MYGRKNQPENYRFGFNGKENDTEYGSSQLVQDYGFRIYNPSIGRFLSVDPLSPEYPFYTPYQFASNSPVWFIDLDGLEGKESTDLDLDKAVMRKAISRMAYVNSGENTAFFRHLNQIVNNSKYAASVFVNYNQKGTGKQSAMGYVGQAVAAHNIESTPPPVKTSHNMVEQFYSEFAGVDMVRLVQPSFVGSVPNEERVTTFSMKVIEDIEGNERKIEYTKRGAEAEKPFVVAYEVKTTSSVYSTCRNLAEAVDQLHTAKLRGISFMTSSYQFVPIVVLDAQMWEDLQKAKNHPGMREEISSAMGLLYRMNGGLIVVQDLTNAAKKATEILDYNVSKSSSDNSDSSDDSEAEDP